jgi:peptidoglycan/xylan/chitin deacetylase (PgdA/CDA1 family)
MGAAAHFDEHMALLRASRTVMLLAELVDCYKRNVLPRNSVAITFGDGYVDNLANAKPILGRYGVFRRRCS